MVLRLPAGCATPISLWAAVLCLGAAGAGCQREQIRVYLAPKEAVASAERERERGPQPHVHYKTPEGWTDLGAAGMRLARFSVPNQNGGDLDVSVIALPEITASKLDIVNLWREQVRLKPATEQDLSGITQAVEVGGKPGDLFDMVSEEGLIQETMPARILVAMVNDQGMSWFIKMTGEDQAVRTQKPAFVEFLRSLTFDYAAHDTTPEITDTRQGGTSATQGKPPWQVPAHWQEVEPTEMLLAKFVVAGKGEEKAEVTVSVFPGQVGGAHANINRWRRQIGLPELDETGTKNLSQPLDVSARDAILVDMSGAKTRLIGAIVPEGSRTWFYKIMGSPTVAEAEKATLVRFIQSAKHNNGG